MKAAGYLIAKWELVNSTNGYVQGATLHRRARAHARAHDPLLALAGRGRHPALQRALARLVAAGGSGRAVALRGARDRRALPDDSPGPQGQSRTRSRSRRPTSNATSKRRGPPSVWTTCSTTTSPARPRSPKPRSRPTRPRSTTSASGTPPTTSRSQTVTRRQSIQLVLRLHDALGRPLLHQRQAHAGPHWRAPDQHREPAVAQLGQPAPAVHPRHRGRGRWRPTHVDASTGNPIFVVSERPAAVDQRHADAHPARHLLRHRAERLGRRQHQAARARLPGELRVPTPARRSRPTTRAPAAWRSAAFFSRFALALRLGDFNFLISNQITVQEPGDLRARRAPDGPEGRAVPVL